MKSPQQALIALPVYNEAATIHAVLDQVVGYGHPVLVVNDGSTDDTLKLLHERDDIMIVSHEKNSGYGAALLTAFAYAQEHKFDVIVTMDCDGQHEPQLIPKFVKACRSADIVSGSRYLKQFPGASEPPAQRLFINRRVTSELNRLLGFQLTDAFCGFKAYRVEALSKMDVTETGYAMPLELWVEAAKAGLNIVELPVPLIYLDENRSFGGALDDGGTRLNYYHFVLDRSLARSGLAKAGVQALASC
ncbi:glycosyltransferase family 2 protein [Blastopirellula marina]|uniref:Glycosyltransferase family 2 protein n=1 Tax=Blastopirellula marina TaxID=124 RepID=A0A2S8FHB7_9BACT|nr:glycosyltransferase family 2 protein [Blastopirellula marina]PQO31543.1 glycosyltransferase family 2 protein [Blastopirellula marina]PTL42849.1 glycosyltransferase family 2 protein [Blastopirellula marina]